MISQKIGYSWRTCQPYENYYYNGAVAKKQYSPWKILLSVAAAFFVVFFAARVLSSVSDKMANPSDQTTAWHRLLGIKTAQAAPPRQPAGGGFSAQKMASECDQLVMKAGETKTCAFAFLNTGIASWSNNSARFASIYTTKPNYRASAFVGSDWYKDNQPAKMKTPLIQSGQVAFFDVSLTAPKQAGDYTEYFRLALEDTAWVSNGIFSVKIKVIPASTVSAVGSAVNQTKTELPVTEIASYNSAAPIGVQTYQAEKLIQSNNSLEFKDQNKQLVRVGFKNVGLDNLNNAGNEATRLVAIDATTRSFFDNSWLASDQVALIKDKAEPGQIAYVEFYLSPSAQAGSFTASFQLKVGERIVAGSNFSLPIKVQPGGVMANKNLTTIGSNGGLVLASEPIVRVGLTKVTMPVTLQADYDYEIWAGSSNLLANVSANLPTMIAYDVGQYTITTNGLVLVSSQPVRLAAKNGANGVFTISSYTNRPSWNLTLNDNQFRGTMEVNYSDTTSRVWVINELPMESYLRGLGESSNLSALEYQKALVTAARSYAYYHYQTGGGKFTVYDTSASQIYLGYGAEKRLPKISQAVDATRGQLVAYNDVPVVTPYFSQSDGRTRSWSEVWGGDKAWLVSVSVPQDASNSLWGHGVGMSCRAAINMANAGQPYDQILKHFYSGTGLKQLW
ncbi:MAG: SpoIID/LytB domain-containing protein [bacterium]